MIKDWLPPELLRLLRSLSGRGVRFQGEYPSWDNAAKHAYGYDAGDILCRVLDATLAVRDGKAAFERDGVLFAEPDYPYPLLAGLLRVAAIEGGRLNVLDFGGALGSSYFQCLPWLSKIPILQWRVIEQSHFVACGRERIADGVLSFSDRIEDCKDGNGGIPNVALLSGVLQYLKDPHEVLARIAALGIKHIIVDRTPVIEGDVDVISVQVVPKRILRSSYPVRLFCRNGLLKPLEQTYWLFSECPAVDGVLGGWRRRVEFKCFILEMRI